MVCLSVAVPMLERADVSKQTAIEHHHDPSTCPRGHDHTVCTQAGANLALAAARPAPDAGPALTHVEMRVAQVVALARAYADGPPSRAPPAA